MRTQSWRAPLAAFALLVACGVARAAVTVDPLGPTGAGGRIRGHRLLVGAAGSVSDLDGVVVVDGVPAQLSHDPLPPGVRLEAAGTPSADGTDASLRYRFSNETGRMLAGFSVAILVDAEIAERTNGFANEYAVVSGVPVAGTSHQVEEPGFLGGRLPGLAFLGRLPGENRVPPSAPDDVAVALAVEVPQLLAGDVLDVEVLVSEDGETLGGTTVRQHDADPAAGTTITYSLRALVVPAKRDCAFLAAGWAHFNNDASIDGDVGVNDPRGLLRLGRKLRMADGTVARGDQVRLGVGASVYDVEARILYLGPGASVRGQRRAATVPLASPYCGAAPVACGGRDVTVRGGRTERLAPGSYGEVRVMDGGSLTLEAGTYAFCSLRAGRKARVVLEGAAASTLGIRGDFVLENGATLTTAGGAPPPALTVRGRLVRVGADAVLHAFVRAPEATITLGRSAVVLGSFCVRRVSSDKHLTLRCAPSGMRSAGRGGGR